MSKTSIAGIAFVKGKVLIAKRNPTGQMGGRWEFPGGKVEQGETDEQAVVREFTEEFGIKVKVGPLVANATFRHDDELVNLHAYLIKVPHTGNIFRYHLTEHTDYEWIEIDKIQQLNFVDSDLLLYPDVKRYFISNGYVK